MTVSLRHIVAAHGYAFIQSYLPHQTSNTIASNIGKPVSLWNDSPIQQLVPTEQTTATPNTYSGIYGLQRFPFHTDLAHWRLPPRYLMLRCVVGYPEISTLLIDSQSILETVTQNILSRAVVKPRRPRDGAVSLLRICEPTNDSQLFRWDEVFLKPASKVGELGMKRVREEIQSALTLPISLTNRGDTLVIDNWRMLHSRAAIPRGREDRKIERIYLEIIN